MFLTRKDLIPFFINVFLLYWCFCCVSVFIVLVYYFFIFLLLFLYKFLDKCLKKFK